MFRAAALLLGLVCLWVLSVQRWQTWQDLALALGAALLCTLVALRAGPAPAEFARAPFVLFAAFRRAFANLRGALSVLHASVARRSAIRPSLLRLRTRTKGAERAGFASAVSVTPGFVVVDADEESLLIHTLHEAESDAAHLSRLEGALSPGSSS